jgi:hypothetical protein
VINCPRRAITKSSSFSEQRINKENRNAIKS